MLTETQKKLINQIAIDEESGNHFVCARSTEYWEMSRRLNLAFDNKNKQADDIELINEYRNCFYSVK